MKFLELYDCIIIGGGPAGLNAAVVLGRSLKRVLIFDTGQQRNRASHSMHNFLTRDDIMPTHFLDHCHKELKKYKVQRLNKKITGAKKNEQGVFVVKDEKMQKYFAKKLLVATGLSDNLPKIEGFAQFYGASVFHCPYCDAWEVKNKKIGVYARNKEGWELALSLKGWSKKVTLFTDGRNNVKPSQKAHLDANDVDIVNTPIKKLEGKGHQLKKIIFKNGEEKDCDAIFFVNGFEQQCNIAEAFGCKVNKKGVIITNHLQQTDIAGLYVAGDAAKDMHFVVVAAAQGAKAGVTINKELQKETLMQQA